MDEHTQAASPDSGWCFWTSASPSRGQRVGLEPGRPLLIGTNPRAQLKALLEQRLPVYDELAWLTVSTDGRDPDEIAAEIAAVVEGGAVEAAASDRDRIAVGGERPYDVVVGHRRADRAAVR